MRRFLSLLAAVVVIAPLGVVLTTSAASAATFTPLEEVRSLTTLADLAHASGINASGQVVGSSADDERDTRPHGFLTDATNTSVTRLDSLGPNGDSDFTGAVAINDEGDTAGFSPLASGQDPPVHAVVWNPGGGPTDLGALGMPCNGEPDTCNGSEAAAINNTGTAVGGSDVNTGPGPKIDHTFTDALATLTMTDIGTLPGGTNSSATDVNDAGTVVGASETSDGHGGITNHAYVYDLTTKVMTDIGTLPGGTSSGAAAVNERGLVVGTSALAGGDHPFTYDTATHVMTDLGLPSGATSAQATAVNDDGVVVGNSDAGAWLYNPATRTFAIIPGAGNAAGINNDGEIVGVGDVPDASSPPPQPIVSGPYRTFAPLSPPNPPTNLRITTVCGVAPTLHWTASASKPLGHADSYIVFRNGLMIAKVTGTAYADNSAVAPATYTVAASNADNDLSPMSNAVMWNCQPGITGTVTSNGAPIGGVDVRVYVAGTTTLVAKAETDPAGHYGIPVIAAGSYNLRFSDPSGRVVLEWNGGSATQAGAPPVVVTAMGTVTVDADLAAAGIISGLAGEGETVRVYPLGAASAIAKTETTARNERNYTVSGLAPGQYQLLFSEAGYPAEWNGGGRTRAAAPPVTVIAGSTTEVDVNPPDPGEFTGLVTGAGSPQAGVAVRVYDTGTNILAAKTVTGSDGTYTVEPIAAGSYQIRFSAAGQPFAVQWANGVTSQAQATTFNLGGFATTTVNAALVAAPP